RTGRQRRLLRVRSPERAPAWSPDGSQLAFVAPFGPTPAVGIVALSDGRLVRVASLASPSSPPNTQYEFPAVAWSSDGHSIAFTKPNGELVSVPATGGTPTVIVSQAALAAACPESACRAFN